MNLKTILPLSAVALISSANAQSISAYQFVGRLNDVWTIAHSQTSYEFGMGLNPSMEIGGGTYQIDWIQGFSLLNDTGGQNAVWGAPPDWSVIGDGNFVTGIKTPPGLPSVILPGESLLWSEIVSVSNGPNAYGWHVGSSYFAGGTGFVRVVPEPATYISLCIGLTVLMLARKRRRQNN